MSMPMTASDAWLDSIFAFMLLLLLLARQRLAQWGKQPVHPITCRSQYPSGSAQLGGQRPLGSVFRRYLRSTAKARSARNAKPALSAASLPPAVGHLVL